MRTEEPYWKKDKKANDPDTYDYTILRRAYFGGDRDVVRCYFLWKRIKECRTELRELQLMLQSFGLRVVRSLWRLLGFIPFVLDDFQKMMQKLGCVVGTQIFQIFRKQNSTSNGDKF